MPRNKLGGKKNKRKKNKSNKNTKKVPIQYAEKGQVYALVHTRLGGNYVELKCSDNKDRKGYIRGKFRNRVYFNQGDIVLASLNQFGNNNDEKCTIETKYWPYQVETLKSKGLLNFLKKDDDKVVNWNDEIDDVKEEGENQNVDEIVQPNWESNNNDEAEELDEKQLGELLDFL